jgi:hypothetical protein
MKKKLHTSYSISKAWTLLVLVLLFLSVSILNQTPFIKDLTNHPSAESLLEANALTLIKKTYKIPVPEHMHFMLVAAILSNNEPKLKETQRSTSEHFYTIDRIHSKYSNIPPPELV